MNAQEFQALVIDRHLGELPPEAAKLFDAYLDAVPARREEAESLIAVLGTARTAVQRHPELARTPPPDAEFDLLRLLEKLPRFARAAVVPLLLAVLTGIGGYVAGRTQPPRIAAAPPPVGNSPWARYRIAANPAGPGLEIVRLDERGAIRVR